MYIIRNEKRFSEVVIRIKSIESSEERETLKIFENLIEPLIKLMVILIILKIIQLKKVYLTIILKQECTI